MGEQKFNILICGKIRSLETFLETIAVYRGWLEAGSVHRVVLSSWESEYHLHKDELEAAAKWGLEIILSPEPTFETFGFIFHQQKTLRYGLSLFDQRDWVIKSRTDKAVLDLDLQAAERRFGAAAPPGVASPFRHRLMIMNGLILQPFFFNDMTLAGEAADLRLIASSDLWYEFFNAAINAEQAIHGTHFILRDKLLRDFFILNPGLVHDDAGRAVDLQAWMLSQPFYIQVLARSLQILKQGYVVGVSTPGDPWVPPRGVETVEGLVRQGAQLSSNGLFFAAGANNVVFTRQEAVEYILSLPISTSNPRSISESYDPRFGFGAEDRFDGLWCEEAVQFASELNQKFKINNPARVPLRIGNGVVMSGRIPIVRSK